MYDYYGFNLGDMLIGFFAAYLVLAIFILLVGLLAYVMGSVGMYQIASRRGMANPWMAWLPYASSYLLGAIADDINKRKNKVSNYRWLLLGFLLSSTLFPLIIILSPFVATVLGIFSFALALATTVIGYIAYYMIYEEYTHTAAGLLVLSILVSPALPFILFAIRNNDGTTMSGTYSAGQISGHQRSIPVGGGTIAPAGGAYGDGGKVTGVAGMYQGVSFPIGRGEELLIGRDSATAHVIIDQGADKISRKHCGIMYDESNRTYRVTDYSMNGTFKEDGTRLMANVPAILPIGSVIILANRQVSFRLG
jgi:hypothetical protein